MSTAWSDVLDIAPELSTVATGTFQSVLATADRLIDVDAWGEFADDGRKYLAAHLATISNGGAGGAAGPIISETLGPMSRSYASPSSSDDMDTTKYGRWYASLLRIAVGPGVLVT